MLAKVYFWHVLHMWIWDNVTCSQNVFLVTTGDAHVYANNACLLVETIYSMHLAALLLALQTQLLVFVTCSSFHCNIQHCAKMINTDDQQPTFVTSCSSLCVLLMADSSSESS